MFSSHSFLNRKRSLTGGDARRFSLSDGELAFELKKKNGDLARENAILKEKCRQLEQKMRALERIDIDIYPDKVPRLIESMKPIYAELEAFEGKVAQMKEHIRDQMQALVAEPSQRTSVAAFCRLSEVEREHHRKSAAFRLQEVANNWNLSFTGRTLANLPATQEDVFDEESESETSAANKSFISLIPQKTSQRKGRQSSKVPDPISGATGDHPVISDAQDTEPQNVHESEDTVLVHHETADELTGFKHAEEMAKPEQGKRKAATRPAVVRKPRTKKVVVATAAVSDDAMGEANLAENLATPSEDLVASCPPAADVNATNNLRPRRKGANYKVGEDTSTPKKKKLVKRRKKAIPSE